ncbi:MAG: Asp-tRNA(Asn)/Glu-tRNA(Gln) amidotransferase subunit GatC [Eubacteriales bacterium]|jgi:aspartyl-tRNA(Asn)/glutamyl-tRNA(Gln) amidotransferase subunit C
MAEQITDETIDYVSILAKLKLDDKGREKAKEDMQRMLDYVDKLNDLDTSDVEPMTHVFPLKNVFREDKVTNGDGREAMLANAPVKEDDQYVVPITIE